MRNQIITFGLYAVHAVLVAVVWALPGLLSLCRYFADFVAVFDWHPGWGGIPYGYTFRAVLKYAAFTLFCAALPLCGKLLWLTGTIVQVADLSYLRLMRAAHNRANPFATLPHWFGERYAQLVAQYMVAPSHDEITAMRQVFRSCDVSQTKRPASEHTHPTSAAQRSSAYILIDLICASLGRSAYWYQRSASDSRRGRAGYRAWFWAKDVHAEMRFNTPPRDAILVLGDVDYQLDMPDFLARAYPAPVIMFTKNPSAVAGHTGEAHFCFDTSNRLVWEVAGGATYTHTIWDYNHDTIQVTGTNWATVFYQVERRTFAPHQDIVFLVPLAMVPRFDKWFMPTLDSVELDHVRVNEGRFSRMRVVTAEGVKVSTGLAGVVAETTVPLAIDHAIATAARLSKLELTNHQTASWLPSDVDPALAATNVVEYHRENAKTFRTVAQTVFPAEYSVRGYELYHPHADNQDEMVAFCTPIIHGGFVPRSGMMNDAWMVKTRVVDLANDTDMPPRFAGYMREFVEMLVPEPHKLHPVDNDEVYARQNRPTQRMLLWQAEASRRMDREGDVIRKKESYQKIGDPRGITIISNTQDKREYSRYTYALATLLEQTHWYAFGKTGAQVAQRVADICSKSTHVHLTDFSRMDGRVSRCFRVLESAIYHRAFHPSHYEQMEDLLRSQHHIKCTTMRRIRYTTEYARLSGSPETAICNSADNAFVAFCCFREMGHPPREAWTLLGVYGGDDGATGNSDEETYVRVAAHLGQLLEITKVGRGSNGVDFLARWYGPGVWYGDINSCCDIPRTLRKFHLTVRMSSDVTPQRKFLEKTFALALTDAQTPLISCLVDKALAYEPDFMALCTGLLLTHAAHISPDDTSRYPNAYADWMVDRLLHEIPGCNPDALFLWSQNGARDDLLTPPLVEEPKPAPPHAHFDTVCDGELVPAKGKTKTQAYQRGTQLSKANPKNAVSLLTAMVPMSQQQPTAVAPAAAPAPAKPIIRVRKAAPK